MSPTPTFDPGYLFQDRPLLDHISRMILRWIRRYGVPERDRDDVKQNVLIAVHRGLPSFDSQRAFGPWLKTIAYRSIRDHLELAFHRREHLLGGLDEHPDCDDPSAEQRLISAEGSEKLWSVLQTLDPPRRDVLVLHDHDGLPMAAIAAAQGIPVNTGYTRLRMARADVRSRWKRPRR